MKKAAVHNWQSLFWFVLNSLVLKQVITCDCIIPQLVDKIGAVLNKVDGLICKS